MRPLFLGRSGDYFFSVVVVLVVVLDVLPGVLDVLLSLGLVVVELPAPGTVVVVVLLLVDVEGADLPGSPAGPGVADGLGTGTGCTG